MNSTTSRAITRARASPISDETAIPRARTYPVSDEPQDGENARAFPRSDENVIRAPPQAPRMRISTWNVGSMTGRSTELGKVLQHRRINICCVQETKWKGSKSRNIGCGYKLIYHGTRAHNGVGIVMDRDLQERIVEVKRVSERLMSIKFALDNQPCMNVISAYAPQAGCANAGKDIFWEEVNDLLYSIPPTELKYVCGDLNGHVGQNTTVYNSIHGNFGYGTTNVEGENILEFASAHDLAIINTFFAKQQEHLITYKSGNASSQIDFILANRDRLKTFKDCKVIPGEPLISQHRILVAEFLLPHPIRMKKERIQRIRWKRLNEQDGGEFSLKIERYLHSEIPDERVSLIWRKFQKFCIDTAKQHLGVSKGIVQNGKDTSWWNPEIDTILKEKKRLFKQWLCSKTPEDRERCKLEYAIAKKAAKRVVAQVKALSNENFYAKIETTKEAQKIFKIAKQRHNNCLTGY
ncbi:craniofacial development protein 2-like [Nilaparvata lugens]|uniref:craniofacial development protein 2-like n=1 Tax=Nilaparvata lugens TaxID=108931 RepID=UPI00193DF0A9|nr:craniofacial development protein 2-like [Nilaparvata lugens]